MLKKGTIIAICMLALAGLIPTSALSADCAPWIARLVSLEGKVEVRRSNAARWLPTGINETYCFGDQLRVGAQSRASVELNNDTILRLDQKSLLILPEAKKERLSFVELLKGALHLISRVKGRLEVRTPFVNAGLEGTEFVVRVQESETQVSVIEGKVKVSNDFGSLHLIDGQVASGTLYTAPVLRLDLKPEDAVRWAIHYPVIAPDQTAAAADILDIQRSLQVGRVDEAAASIERLLAEEPDNSDATALAAIVQLAQNRKDEALRLAERAVMQGSTLASLSALSYAQQAKFDLKAAAATARRATELFPEQALAWARLAELRASLGQRDDALAAAQRAVALDPDLSRAQTVLGFNQLIKGNIADARSSFDRAVALDSTDPLPRLGLGLSRIRAGDLAAGRRDMEIAVSLDPANAFVRSYLGKAYSDEGRIDEAMAEFALARQLDPNDPTPWLYQALSRQAANQPVAAIRDFEQSIALNNNRAVFRSKLMLDADQAVRNSNLGRVYADLGLRDVARRHATKSLSLNPANSAAHALMAESFRAVPRLGITRMSEQLQARLQQPLSARPIAPSELIPERDPSAGLGRLAAGAGEYSALFDSPGPRTYLAGFAGGNDSAGLEILHSRLFDKASVSVGYHKFETEGFRSRADLEYETYNLFAQFTVNDHVDLQFEARHQNKRQGDLRMDPIDLPNDENRSLDSDVFRAGANIRLDMNTTLLLSLGYVDRNEIAERIDFGVFVTTDEDERNAWVGEIQLQHKLSDDVQLKAGAATRKTRYRYDERVAFGPFVFPLDSGHETIRSSSAYVYADWAATEDILWTAGVSFDDHKDPNEGSSVEFSRFNPKLGVQWQITPRVLLRAAHIRTTKHQLAVEETIEPTQVAGFAQFFDDFNRTQADMNAVALDLRPTDNTFGTISYSKRDIDFIESTTWIDEENFRAVFSALLSDEWTAQLGYVRQRDRTTTPSRFDLITQSIPLTVTYHAANGFFGELNWTAFDQEKHPSGGNTIQTRFHAVDLMAGYSWNRNKNRVRVGVNDLLDKIDVYEDDRFKTNDALNVHRPFVPGRSVWASIEIAID